MREAQYQLCTEIGTLDRDKFGLWQLNADWKFAPPAYKPLAGGTVHLPGWPADELAAMFHQSHELAALPELVVTDDIADR